MKIVIINKTKTKLNENNIQKVFDLIIKSLKKNKAINLKIKSKLEIKEIILVLIGLSKMKKINFEFRNKNYATDVLSFSSTDKQVLGELVFCPMILKKQALANNHSLDFEMLYMCIHGLLHLLGYDHEVSEVEAQKMFALQDKLFSGLTESKINLKLTHVNRSRT